MIQSCLLEKGPKQGRGALLPVHWRTCTSFYISGWGSANHPISIWVTSSQQHGTLSSMRTHTNVDRLWEIFRTQFMKMPDFKTHNPDWLEASFIFYDENRRVVKVKVKDALDITKLGYSYADLSVQWKKAICIVPIPQPITNEARLAEFGSMTRALAEYPIRILVKRPNSSRHKSDIEKTVEVVVVDGIEAEHTSSTWFDVYISTPENSTDVGGFSGSFITVAHGHGHGNTADSTAKKLSLKLGITNLVAELDAEIAESLVTMLVPQTGLFLIDGVHIEQNNIK
ncbi:polyphenol oxidase A1, chloroplastic-like [Magnolia sinica]|uniref:polyphenol oxidase A1, chloroplastic-like n=1 Tax=Magnolia sinica TaxID=86752 RepID=UPI002657B754|nr:polyphenol oxidase A1, chloroplastic-like [Magnolia sinica]